MKYMLVFLLMSMVVAVHAQPAPEVTDEPQAGAERTDAHGIEQVYVPAGCFLMGITAEEASAVRAQRPTPFVLTELPSEIPQHEVCLTFGYWLDKYEVTNAAYQAFVEDGGYTDESYWSEDGLAWLNEQNVDELPAPCHFPEPDRPRACVTWYEAQAYAAWRGGALPSEAQWEYAARGPDALTYPWGDEWNPTLANVVEIEGTTPVGSYPDSASWVGAHDMAGNVMEWVNDWLDQDYYEESPREDPPGPETGRVKVERGGWWGSNQWVARTTYRHYEDPPTYLDHHIGFRIVSPAE